MGRRAMSEELLAVSRISPAPAAQTDYDAICAALMHTERGRWFLDEYAKRNRSADTRLLLAAIERIEAVVCAERNKQAQQGFRTDLLEMAKAITRTRAEVAEIRADGAAAPGQARDNGDAAPPPRPRDVFAAAERIRDVTWAMRGHGFDPSTCNQLEELAGTILSASALRDPTDHRAVKLSEVLQYLERRIDGLLESCADGDTAEPELESELELDSVPGLDSEPKHTNGHTNGFASHHAAEVPAPIIEPCELEAGDFEAEPASPPAPAADPGGALPAARIEVEERESEVIALEAVEIATVAAVADEVVEPDVVAAEAGRDGETVGLSSVLPRAPVPPEAFAGPEPEPSPAPAAAPAESERPGTQAEQRPPESEIPPSRPEPIHSDQLLPRSPDLRTTAAAARLFLPDLEMGPDMPGRPAAAAAPRAAAATVAPAVAADEPATAANLPAPQADPLAGLRAMSESELIALFS